MIIGGLAARSWGGTAWETYIIPDRLRVDSGLEELTLTYRLTTLSVESHRATKQIELLDTRYRELTGQGLTGSEAQKFSNLLASSRTL
jgi:hypothetical protein